MVSYRRIWLILPVAILILAASMFIRPLRQIVYPPQQITPTVAEKPSQTVATAEISASVDTRITGTTAATTPIISSTTPTTTSSAPLPTQRGQAAPITGSQTPTNGGSLVQAVETDADTLNPILTMNGTAQTVARQLLPTLLGLDAQTGLITTTELAERWDVTSDGRVYTFHLRHTITWSDGEPVTARDVQFTYAALANATVQSPFRASSSELEKIETPDAQTVVVTLRAPNCAALYLLRQPLLPSHRYAADFSDIHINALNNAPTISAGPFRFDQWTPGVQISLVRNPNYWQAAPRLEAWRFVVLPDPADQVRQLLGGKIDLMAVKPPLLKKIAGDPAVALYRAPGNSYSFIALNLADPTQPQPGRDDGGALLAQSPHPILGDVRVRQAIAQGIDYTRIMSDVYQNQGEQPTSYLPPRLRWAQDKALQPYAYDPEIAKRLLIEAGWIDPNREGIRKRDGKPLQLTLLTNQDNPQRVRIGELVQQQLDALGFDLHLEAVDFAQVSDALLNQRYDMVVIGWDNMGPDPATSSFWHSRDDVPGSGANFVSFQENDVDRWLDEAAQLPGCSVAERAQRYQQIQRRLWEAAPYIFINSEPTAWAFSHNLQGLAPGPWDFDNQVQSWWKAK